MRLAGWMYVVVFAVACNRMDEAAKPAFIGTEPFTVTVAPGQGSSSSAISELWFYTDGDVLGVVDTPVSLPLMKTGPQIISVFAGIKNNGMGTSRIRYPFYEVYDTTLNIVEGANYTLRPAFSYIPSAIIDASRNFEAGNSFVAGSNNDGIIELLNEPELAASGVRCVRMKLPLESALLSYIDESNITLTPGEVAFMEMDYSCNNTFIVGMYVVSGGNSIKVPVLYLTPTQNAGIENPGWNKIYMDLGMISSQNVSADYYRLYIECLPQESNQPVIYLDDIKIVK